MNVLSTTKIHQYYKYICSMFSLCVYVISVADGSRVYKWSINNSQLCVIIIIIIIHRHVRLSVSTKSIRNELDQS